MENVFVAMVTYPSSGDEEIIEVFDTLEVAREWVVEGIKQYLAKVVADTNDTYHSQEWRASVQEGIEECEESSKTSAQNCTVPVDTSGRKYLYVENNELLGSLYSMWHVVGL